MSKTPIWVLGKVSKMAKSTSENSRDGCALEHALAVAPGRTHARALTACRQHAGGGGLGDGTPLYNDLIAQ